MPKFFDGVGFNVPVDENYSQEDLDYLFKSANYNDSNNIFYSTAQIQSPRIVNNATPGSFAQRSHFHSDACSHQNISAGNDKDDDVSEVVDDQSDDGYESEDDEIQHLFKDVPGLQRVLYEIIFFIKQ
jgi:UDP-N-acetylmuramyl tripeptide synthase